MTENTALMTENQKSVLKNLNKQVADNSTRAVVNAGLLGVSILATAALTYAFPPLGVAKFFQDFGTIFSILQGFNVVEKVGTHFSLMQAKKEVEQDKTFATTEKRARFIKKLDKSLTIAGAGALALFVAAAFIPPLHAVAWPALNSTLGSVLVVAGVTPLAFSTGLKRGVDNAVSFIRGILGRSKDDDAPKAAPEAPATGLANAPGLKTGFDAKADKPAATEAPAKTPAPVVDAPKVNL